MRTPSELARANEANIVGIVHDSELNHSAAELTLRNTAVAIDRLGFFGFNRLSEAARATIIHAAQVADTLAPGPAEDNEKFSSESYGQWQHRTKIEAPLHRLQGRVARLSLGEETLADDKLRYALEASGEAFATILAEAATDPAIVETMRYFRGNTEAAGRAIGRSIMSNIDEV